MDKIDGYKKEEMKKKFLETLKGEIACGNVTVACDRLGYSRSTIYQWREEDAEFEREWDDIVLECKERLGDEAENVLRKLVLKENVAAVIFTLKNLKQKKWKDRTLHEIDDSKDPENYAEYLEQCKKYNIDPETGLRLEKEGGKVEKTQ